MILCSDIEKKTAKVAKNAILQRMRKNAILQKNIEEERDKFLAAGFAFCRDVANRYMEDKEEIYAYHPSYKYFKVRNHVHYIHTFTPL
jgi:hypothetical protein